MNEAQEFIRAFESSIAGMNGSTELYIAPPAPYLAALAHKSTTRLGWASQQCSAFGMGAHTGEYTAQMLKSTGIEAVLIGHSERRESFGESDEVVQQKVAQANQAGLRIFLCCGETLEQRENGNPEKVIFAQLDSAMQGIENPSNFVVAYEPIWAIGTGRTASTEQAQSMHSAIRRWWGDRFGAHAANELPILYGGSCKPSNAEEIFSQPDVNGGLIGGASLNVDDFIELIRIADQQEIG